MLSLLGCVLTFLPCHWWPMASHTSSLQWSLGFGSRSGNQSYTLHCPAIHIALLTLNCSLAKDPAHSLFSCHSFHTEARVALCRSDPVLGCGFPPIHFNRQSFFRGPRGLVRTPRFSSDAVFIIPACLYLLLVFSLAPGTGTSCP